MAVLDHEHSGDRKDAGRRKTEDVPRPPPFWAIPVLWVAAVTIAFVGATLAEGLRWPEPVHPCERWKAKSESLDLEGCYAAFEVDPFPSRE